MAIVNTSNYEGTSNVLLEGWARGVSALVLHHDPDGLVVREGLGAFAAGSTEALADRAPGLWSDRESLDELAAACRAYVLREHAARIAVERWLGVLADA